MTSNDADTREVDREYRLKQLDFIKRIADAETELVLKLGQTIAFANASAIGVCVVMLKDIKEKFGDATILFASTVFVVGLCISGIFLIWGFSAMSGVRIRIKDFVFDLEDISALREDIDLADEAKVGVVFFFLPIFCFLVGVIAILYKLFT